MGGAVTLPATRKQALFQGQAVTVLTQTQTQTHSHKSSPFQLFLSCLLPDLNLVFFFFFSVWRILSPLESPT